jgi:hypothetical protein
MNHQHALEGVPLSSLEFVKFGRASRRPARKIGQASSRKTPNSKAQVKRIKNAKFKMSKLPDAASILAFLILNLLILNWLRRSFWCLGFGAFLELGAWSF